MRDKFFIYLFKSCEDLLEREKTNIRIAKKLKKIKEKMKMNDVALSQSEDYPDILWTVTCLRWIDLLHPDGLK